MNGLADDGLIVAAGPLAGTESGRIRVLLIADADHEAEIAQRLAADPWELAGRITTTTHRTLDAARRRALTACPRTLTAGRQATARPRPHIHDGSALATLTAVTSVNVATDSPRESPSPRSEHDGAGVWCDSHRLLSPRVMGRVIGAADAQLQLQCPLLREVPYPHGARPPLPEREHRLGDLAVRRIGDRSGGLLEYLVRSTAGELEHRTTGNDVLRRRRRSVRDPGRSGEGS